MYIYDHIIKQCMLVMMYFFFIRALDLATGEIVAVKRLQVGEDGMLDEEIMASINIFYSFCEFFFLFEIYSFF